MKLINNTRMQADYNLGQLSGGQECLVAVIKGTFAIPENTEDKPELLTIDQQLKPNDTDTFSGDPASSSPVFENDYVTHKPHCDVILNGHAHAPHGEPITQLGVGLRVGSMQKHFEVYGDRVWQARLTAGVSVSKAEPFIKQSISYNEAYGGIDQTVTDKPRHYAMNPVGRGYAPKTPPMALDGKPLPNTEQVGQPVTSPKGRYQPQSFGGIGRVWEGRAHLAGTYDERWRTERFPFLPDDFNPEYLQFAPRDQWLPHLNGGETVVMMNLMEGREHVSFNLPQQQRIMVRFMLRGQQAQTEQQATLDTLVLEPDQNQFSLVWRAVMPLESGIFEVDEVVVGHVTRAWLRARATGKRYYRSLDMIMRPRS